MQAKLKKLHDQIKTAANAKTNCGLPETTRKRIHENDSTSNPDDDAASLTNDHQQSNWQAKIPCKLTDMTDSFSVGIECMAFVQGWQPIPSSHINTNIDNTVKQLQVSDNKYNRSLTINIYLPYYHPLICKVK